MALIRRDVPAQAPKTKKKTTRKKELPREFKETITIEPKGANATDTARQRFAIDLVEETEDVYYARDRYLSGPYDDEKYGISVFPKHAWQRAAKTVEGRDKITSIRLLKIGTTVDVKIAGVKSNGNKFTGVFLRDFTPSQQEKICKASNRLVVERYWNEEISAKKMLKELQ